MKSPSTQEHTSNALAAPTKRAYSRPYLQVHGNLGAITRTLDLPQGTVDGPNSMHFRTA